MKRTIKIMKASWLMDESNFKWLVLISVIFTGLISINTCFDIKGLVYDYASKRETVQFSNIVVDILYLLVFISIYTSAFLGITNWEGKLNGILNFFKIHAPVSKKDICNFKFALFQVINIPFLIIVVYLIGLNISVSTSDYISAYSGFLVLLYCIWAVTFSINVGISSLSPIHYKNFRYFLLILQLLPFVLYFYFRRIASAQSGTLVTDQNMFSGLGTSIVPILKSCRYIGGLSGLIIILVSSLLSYFFICKLPLTISKKVGD